MRRKRLYSKRNRNKKITFLVQIAAIWYISMFCITSLTSTTGAYYNSTEINESVIQAGTWWDGSMLKFTGIPTQNVKACPEKEITVEVKNFGFSMVGPTNYEIYYSDKGNSNSENTGYLISEGIIEALKKNESVKLTFLASEAGPYKFKLYQRREFQEINEFKQVMWSEKVIVNCKAAKSNDKEQLVDEPKTNDSKEIEVNAENTETTPSPDSQNENIEQKSEENVIENTEANTDKEIKEVEETNSQQKENINGEAVDNKEE